MDLFEHTGCSYCGVNPFVGCKHRSAVPRPVPAEPIEDKPDGRRVSRLQGLAFSGKRTGRPRKHV